MTRKFSTLLLFLTLSLAAFALSPQEAVDRFVKESGVAAGSLAVKITDLSDGNVIASHNSTKPLVPASIMKSVTTAALIDKAGAGWKYETRVFTDGPVDMGILRGNIVVEGASDPSLGTTHEPGSTDIFQEIADALRAQGIHRIEGDILIDESRFAGPSRPDSWQKGDFSQAYGTGSHALNYRDNASGSNSVENPSAIFVSRLISTLSSAGISVGRGNVGHGHTKLLTTHRSETLDEIMRSCMMRSDNLFAEAMLRTFGKLSGGDGSTADAAEREKALWKREKMPLEGVNIIDGSGLSRSNRVTADFMTAVLSSKSDDAVYASFFPLAGQEGTLRKFLVDTPLDSYIAMKTGSMKGIQCYAGYMLDDDYVPTHSVVIIMNDITKSRDTAKKAAERMLLEIFSRQ